LKGSIPSQLGNATSLSNLLLDKNQLNGNIPSQLSDLLTFRIDNNYFTCSEIENFQNISQVGNFIYDKQYYDYVPTSTNIVTSFNGNNTYQLSAPFNSNNPSSLTYQWYKNDELIPGATNSTLTVTVTELEDAGQYTLQIDETCAGGMQFISTPVNVIVDGYDEYGEPVKKKEVIIEYASAADRLEVEDSIFSHYNNEVAVIDSCNCDRELYLYRFNISEDQNDFVLQLNRKKGKGKAIVITDTTLADGGRNNIIRLGDLSVGESKYYVSTNCELTCEETVEVSILDTGFKGDNNIYLNDPNVNPCNNAVEDIIYDEHWHGTFGFNSIVKDFSTNAELEVTPVKIFNAQGEATLFDLICGLYFAIDNNADIINISGGYYDRQPFSILESAIIEAYANGIFIVTSAGNDSINIDERQQYPAYFAKDYLNVISVGSIDPQRNYSQFSNYSNTAVTISAYGEDISSFVENDERQATGTSMATFIASKELANEIGFDKSRSMQQIWEDFEANRLVYKSDLLSKTITGKYLDVTIESAGEDCPEEVELPNVNILGIHQASERITIRGYVAEGNSASFRICEDTVETETELTDNLSLFYPFDGNTLDSTSNNFHGTGSGIDYAVDRFGNPNSAASFDGIDDFINLPNDAALKPNLPVSFSFWIKYDSNSYTDQEVFTTSYEEDRNSGVYFNSQIATGNYGLNYGDGANFYNSTSRRSYVSNEQIDTTAWHHIVAIIKGPTDMSVYVDCIEQGGSYSGTGGNLLYSTTPGSIGRRDRDLGVLAHYFKGKLDDFMYWDRALTIEEVNQLCPFFEGIEPE